MRNLDPNGSGHESGDHVNARGVGENVRGRFQDDDHPYLRQGGPLWPLEYAHH
jgi:hypothetical protein